MDFLLCSFQTILRFRTTKQRYDQSLLAPHHRLSEVQQRFRFLEFLFSLVSSHAHIRVGSRIDRRHAMIPVCHVRALQEEHGSLGVSPMPHASQEKVFLLYFG